MFLLITPLEAFTPEDETHPDAAPTEEGVDVPETSASDAAADPVLAFRPMYGDGVQLGVHSDHVYVVEPVSANVTRLLGVRGLTWYVEGTVPFWVDKLNGDALVFAEGFAQSLVGAPGAAPMPGTLL